MARALRALERDPRPDPLCVPHRLQPPPHTATAPGGRGPKRAELLPAAGDADAVERRLDVLAALALLPTTQRAAVVLVGWAGMTAEEAAQVLGIQPVSVRGRLHRARAALRQRIGDADD